MSKKQDVLDQALDALYASGPSAESASSALKRLEKTMQDVLPPVIHYALLPDTPLGDLWAARSNEGLVAVDYDLTEEEFILHVEEKLKEAHLVHDPEGMAETLAQINEYIQGQRENFKLSVDWQMTTPFQEKVLRAALEIPRGQVATYAEVAKQIGQPGAFRAVGQALRRNPIPIVVPCHRVVASDGTMGGYAGQMGDKRKITLLMIEGVMLA